ncbi:MAG TPA: hypothetical protein VNT54_10780 [Solirubrobacteraceae bacterium]|nr:hypothetical protein [Solirubrobacteraceae bacterium]
MKLGKRRKGSEAPAPASAAASAAPSNIQSWTAPAEEPVVEGEAVELPAPEFHQPEQPGGQMPFPVGEQPVAVVTPGAASAPVTSLGESGEAFASGHAAAPGPSWQEPVMELANERPELVVAAAFAGGVLAAMILRRLGS